MKWMRRKSSLSNDFFMFSLIMLGAVATFSGWFYFTQYQAERQALQDRLPLNTARIDHVISDSIDYIATYAEFIGEKIGERGGQDLEYIAYLMRGDFNTAPQKHNLFISTLFDWVTPDKQMWVSSKQGVFTEPKDMSHRDYLNRTPLHPWTLQFSPPAVGIPSGQWIIPAGMGVTDKNGKYIGAVTMGFAIDGLAKKIAYALGNSPTGYLIINSDFKLVADSSVENSSAPAESALKIPQVSLLHMAEKKGGFLPSPFVINGVEYTYFKKVGKYPFIILSGYPVTLGSAIFHQVVLSRVVEFLTIGIIAMLLLLFMRRRLVMPVLELASAAKQIAEGKENISIPESSIDEVETLAEQLKVLSETIVSERQAKRQIAAKTMQLRLAREEALQARDLAEQANQAKSQFLANMSHELRTPMNVVVGLTHILASSASIAPQQKEILKTLKLSADSLMDLINDLLDIAKIERNEIILESIPFSMRELTEKAVQIFEYEARDKGVSLHVSFALPEDRLFIGDPYRIRQIVTNLVSNALKFTHEGSVEIAVWCEEGEADRCVLGVSVADTGIGIAEEKLGSIFDKFTQADVSTTRKYGGTGLGLAISKSLSQMMGGDIAVKSQLGKGTTFTLTLPLPCTNGEEGSVRIAQPSQMQAA